MFKDNFTLTNKRFEEMKLNNRESFYLDDIRFSTILFEVIHCKCCKPR